MAILRSNKEQRIKLEDLNPFITCELCKGYLIKPTTIAECLHTWERRREEEFDRSVCSGKREVGSLKHKHKESSVDETPRKRHKSSSRKTVDCSDESDSKQNFHRDDPQIGVCLQYLRSYDEEEVTSGKNENGKLDKHTSSIEDLRLNGSMWELVRKYIRCSSRTTIGHIKKYLKLKLKLSAVDQVEVMCNGEIMGKDHTLEFVFMTRWRIKGNTILTLQYRPKLDFL
ncbi:polycomb group RING finger protein 5-B-like isoform X3 [Montipora capricornis]|uniref:polycomb group RING finger protein 5-B-like isoform X3 n=1 Tax=Montipora foliosa TaxID=591990 RepID=UPI0035F11C70